MANHCLCHAKDVAGIIETNQVIPQKLDMLERIRVLQRAHSGPVVAGGVCCL